MRKLNSNDLMRMWAECGYYPYQYPPGVARLWDDGEFVTTDVEVQFQVHGPTILALRRGMEDDGG